MSEGSSWDLEYFSNFFMSEGSFMSKSEGSLKSKSEGSFWDLEYFSNFFMSEGSSLDLEYFSNFHV